MTALIEKRSAGIKSNVRGLRHQWVIEKPLVQGRVRYNEKLATMNGMGAECQITRGFGGIQSDACLEPLPVRIHQGDGRNGRIANGPRQFHNILIGLFNTGVQNLIISQRF